MRWKHKGVVLKSYWSNWFAWYPVKVGHEMVWLEWILRHAVYEHTTMEGTYFDHWEYANKKKGVKHSWIH